MSAPLPVATPSGPSVIHHVPELAADVISTRHEVLWADGSRIGLHPVQMHGCTVPLFRAVHHGGQWSLFDLRQTCPTLAEELVCTPPRDRHAALMLGLRAQFITALDFLATAELVAMVTWTGTDRALAPLAQARRSNTPEAA